MRALLVLGTALALAAHPVKANEVQVVVPAGWRRVEVLPFGPDSVTVLVVGTRGVRPRGVSCQIAAYRIPPAGAAVVVVRWRTETSGGGRPPGSREPLRHMHLDRRGVECWPNHRGGAVQLSLGGHAYQVNVLIGDRASHRTAPWRRRWRSCACST